MCLCVYACDRACVQALKVLASWYLCKLPRKGQQRGLLTYSNTKKTCKNQSIHTKKKEAQRKGGGGRATTMKTVCD